MNILYITPGYVPLVGGGETHVQALAEGMAKRGHRVSVLTDRRNAPEFETLNDVYIYRTHHYRSWLNGPDRVPWEESFFGLLRECQMILGQQIFDIVHAHCQTSVLLASFMGRQLGYRCVASMHETSPHLEPFGTSRSAFIYQHTKYDALIAGSKYFEEQANQYGALVDSVHLIYYGVDIQQFSPKHSGDAIRKSLDIRPEQKLVLLVGRFKARKGILEFIRAMVHVNQVLPDVNGLIVGSCNSASHDYRNAMQAEIKTHRLQQHITIAEEKFDYDEMPAVYAAADLVVQPSYSEGFGIAIAEALASRKPVIATAIPGVSEIISHGHNGWLIEKPDEMLLAQAIQRLLTDCELAKRLAIAGCQTIRNRFNIDTMLLKTEAVYRALLVKDE